MFRLTVIGTNATLTWTSVSNRLYYVEKNRNLGTTNWIDSGLELILPGGTTTTRRFDDTNAAARFYRVQAVVPLSP
ncbi:MAG: hypothetical protein ABSE16_03515 [Verrucomicrobiota bacterium]